VGLAGVATVADRADLLSGADRIPGTHPDAPRPEVRHHHVPSAADVDHHDVAGRMLDVGVSDCLVGLAVDDLRPAPRCRGEQRKAVGIVAGEFFRVAALGATVDLTDDVECVLLEAGDTVPVDQLAVSAVYDVPLVGNGTWSVTASSGLTKMRTKDADERETEPHHVGRHFHRLARSEGQQSQDAERHPVQGVECRRCATAEAERVEGTG